MGISDFMIHGSIVLDILPAEGFKLRESVSSGPCQYLNQRHNGRISWEESCPLKLFESQYQPDRRCQRERIAAIGLTPAHLIRSSLD
jgi:hypothetical protein